MPDLQNEFGFELLRCDGKNHGLMPEFFSRGLSVLCSSSQGANVAFGLGQAGGRGLLLRAVVSTSSEGAEVHKMTPGLSFGTLRLFSAQVHCSRSSILHLLMSM